MNIKTMFFWMFAILMFSGCATREHMDYTAFKNADPHSILVAMPSSVSNDVNSGPAVLASVSLPLSEAGYYVIPVTLANETFKYNGVSDASEIRNIPREKIKEVFGVDAIMYLTINEYQTHYTLLDSYFQVSVTAELVNVSDGTVLWKETSIMNNKSGSSGNIFADLIAALFKHAINEAAELGYNVSVNNSYMMFTPDNPYIYDPILSGPYSPKYRKDRILNK